MMQVFSGIIFCLTLNEQRVLGDCGNCNKSSSAYKPVCAVGEQVWFRHIFFNPVRSKNRSSKLKSNCWTTPTLENKIFIKKTMTIPIKGFENIFL